MSAAFPFIPGTWDRDFKPVSADCVQQKGIQIPFFLISNSLTIICPSN